MSSSKSSHKIKGMDSTNHSKKEILVIKLMAKNRSYPFKIPDSIWIARFYAFFTFVNIFKILYICLFLEFP